jgi:chromosomal replication initiator protein
MQADAVWQAVLGEIELSISHGNFITWFKNTSLEKQADETVVIGVTNVFIKNQLEKKYGTLIIKTLAKNGIDAKHIEYKMSTAQPVKAPVTTVAASLQTEAVQRPASNSLPGAANSQPANTILGGGLAHSYRQGLNERYKLDDFVVGANNEVAFAACQAIADQPGTRYNPLFLYGGVGIGKTHLLQGVGNALAARSPKAKILYITSEQFTQEFVDALRLRKTPAFARHYRTADALIVDDVQFLGGKEKTQEEFFHTFNALHQANKQIIISADKPPKDIPSLEDRLRSRFGGGMSIDMQIPDFETRCAIVQAKAQGHGHELDSKVVEYLASNINTNIRELEGALNQLLAFCEVRGLEPTIGITSGLITASKSRPKHLSARQIIERTARQFQIPVEDIVGPKRDKDIVVPRQVAMYILRNELKLSFPKIARELGRKDHTTAIHSVDKIDRESRSDPVLRMAIAEIKEFLYA